MLLPLSLSALGSSGRERMLLEGTWGSMFPFSRLSLRGCSHQFCLGACKVSAQTVWAGSVCGSLVTQEVTPRCRRYMEHCPARDRASGDNTDEGSLPARGQSPASAHRIALATSSLHLHVFITGRVNGLSTPLEHNSSCIFGSVLPNFVHFTTLILHQS